MALGLRKTFILFGDSITQYAFAPDHGFAGQLADLYQRKADIVNRGLSGYNTAWAIQALPQLFPNQPCPSLDLVVIFFGANDAALPDGLSANQHIALDEYIANLQVIVEYIKERHPDVKILLLTPPPVDEDGRIAWGKLNYPDSHSGVAERKNEYTGKYAAAIMGSALTRIPNVGVVDVWTEMQKDRDWKSHLNDGLHFSPGGQNALYRLLADGIKTNFPSLAEENLFFDLPLWSQIDHKDVAGSYKAGTDSLLKAK